MSCNKTFGVLSAALFLIMANLMFARDGSAQNRYKTLYKFTGGKDGSGPYAGLTLDSLGNLYGTTLYGGSHSCGNGNGCGTVFMLTPSAGGGWIETVLHSFNNDGKDGYFPDFSGLTFDSLGNLYGTTQGGGSGACQSGGYIGCGTVFELIPNGGGSWTENVLYSFSGNGVSGAYPAAGVIFDAAGNLYGTTQQGGAYNRGTVFRLASNRDGSWTESVLHSFNEDGKDGYDPYARPIFDSLGNLYGTTYLGGAYNWGTVFELDSAEGGGWTETVLYSFDNKDGATPFGGLVFDSAGNLYGTTAMGGADGYGTAFRLTPRLLLLSAQQ